MGYIAKMPENSIYKTDKPIFKEGDKVKISVNHRGREWTSPTGEVKYFNSIIGWKIEKLAS